MAATVTTQATVELTLPGTPEVNNLEIGLGMHRSVKIGLRVELNDFVLKIPSMGGKGEQTLTIKKLVLRGLHGHMLPIVDADNNVVFFTLADAEKNRADEPSVVGG